MAFDLVRKMIGKRRAGKEEHVAEKVFGNVLKFRVGSPVSISSLVTDLFPAESLFKATDASYDQMIISSISSFTFDGTRIYRLRCENPSNSVIQIQEEDDEIVGIMLFTLVQEEWLTSREDVDAWKEYISGDSIDNDGTVFNKVFGPVDYTQTLNADESRDSGQKLSYTMSLFDRDIEEEVEYMLFTLGEDDGWELNGYAGINIPVEEITIL